MTGTSVVAIKYKDGILMVSDLGGQSKIFSIFIFQHPVNCSFYYVSQHVYHFLFADNKTLLEVMFLSLCDFESLMYVLPNYKANLSVLLIWRFN